MKKYDNHYNAYLDSVFNLAGTITVRSSASADAMNTAALKKTGNPNIINIHDKSTWPYYMNLCGEYHPSNDVMKVTSMDTLQTIVFNKENLVMHNNTRREYSYGTHKYEELINKYPDQELLIRGILYPVDLQKALDSVDGTILSYAPEFVEANEYSLMERLEEWSLMYYKRWWQPQYTYNHNRFIDGFLGVYYTKLVEAILTTRLEMCKTNEAHSFHIRRFLASHDFMDFYMDMMTTKQSLKFYMNIPWIIRNIGQRATFDYLVRWVMTERGLPIASYEMAHNEMPIILGESLKPKPTFVKKTINGLEVINPEIDTLTTAQIMQKEEDLAINNPETIPFAKIEADAAYQTTLSNSEKTKVLESKIIDYADSENVNMESILADHWVDLVDRGLFKAFVLVQNPINGETLPLSGRDALILLNYALMKAYGENPTCIPHYNITLGARMPRPSEKELRNMVMDETGDYLPQWWYDYLLKTWKPIREIMSIDAFYEQAKEIFDTYQDRETLVAFETDSDARAFKEATFWRMYSRKKVTVAKKGETYQSFLSSISLEGHLLNNEQWHLLATDIWEITTGVRLRNTKSLRNVHRAMLQIMDKLSSYTVHYIGDINSSAIVPVRNIGARLQASPATQGFQEDTVDVANPRLQNNELTGYDNLEILYDEDNRYLYIEATQSVSIDDIEVTPINVETIDTIIETDSAIGNGIQGYMEADILTYPNPSGIRPVPGLNGYLALPLTIQRQIAKDMFGVDLEWSENRLNETSPKEPIEWNIRNDHLLGFNYTGKTIPEAVADFNKANFIWQGD